MTRAMKTPYECDPEKLIRIEAGAGNELGDDKNINVFQENGITSESWSSLRGWKSTFLGLVQANDVFSLRLCGGLCEYINHLSPVEAWQ